MHNAKFTCGPVKLTLNRLFRGDDEMKYTVEDNECINNDYI